MRPSRLLLFVLVAAWACAGPARDLALTDEQLLIKASALTKVAAALESAVRFKGAPERLSEEELKDFATRHDPGLLEPFRSFTVRVRRQGPNSSVLLCTADGRTGLIEDAGCTARVDARLWEREPQVGCEFALDLEAVCAPR